MKVVFRLNIVNKIEYDAYEKKYYDTCAGKYKEVITKIPTEGKDLEKDIEYLGLKYDDVSLIKDIRVLNCEIISPYAEELAQIATEKLSVIINRTNHQTMVDGDKVKYQDMNKIYAVVQKCGLNFFLAVLEAKKEEINNIKDLILYLDRFQYAHFYNEVTSYEEYGEYIVNEQINSMSEIIEYIDLEKIGMDYIEEDAIFTNYGLIIGENSLDLDKKNILQEEEEFE